MSATRAIIAQKILAAFGLDTHLTIKVLEDKHVSSSTLSAYGIRRFVNPHYDVLEDDTTCKLVQRGVNDTYLISSADRHYSLKVYSLHWRSPESILDELQCIESLGIHGVPVAAAIPRDDGAAITLIPTPEGTRCAVMFAWMNGMVPSFADSAHSAQIGRSMAQLHARADEHRLGSRRPRLTMTDLFDRPLARIRSELANEPSHVARFDALAERLALRIPQATRDLEDWGFCHGDAAHVNLRVDGHRIGFFDFEWCGGGWRVYDLATYLWSAYHIGNARDFDWKPLVDSYFHERPQFAASARFIPMFVVLRHLWYAAQVIGLAPYLGHNVVANRFFEKFLALCEGLDLDMMSAPQRDA